MILLQYENSYPKNLDDIEIITKFLNSVYLHNILTIKFGLFITKIKYFRLKNVQCIISINHKNNTILIEKIWIKFQELITKI